VEASRGRFVAFLDADDLWLPQKLAKQISLLQQRTECGACYTGATIADVALRALAVDHCPEDEITVTNLLVRGNLLPAGGSSILCSRDLLHQLGGFDPELSLCADWDMWLRLAGRTRFAGLADPLVVYRRTPGSMSRNARVLERDTLSLLAKAFSQSDARYQGEYSRAYGRQYLVLSGSHLHAGRYIDSVRCLLCSLRQDPGGLACALGVPLRAVRRRLGGVAHDL
jgi:hypothetical protein